MLPRCLTVPVLLTVLVAPGAHAQTLRERIVDAEDARAGIDVVDAVLEGDVIARIELQ